MSLVGAGRQSRHSQEWCTTFCTSIQRLAGEHAVGGVSCPFPEVLMSAFSPSASGSTRRGQRSHRRGHLKGNEGRLEGAGGPRKHGIYEISWTCLDLHEN